MNEKNILSLGEKLGFIVGFIAILVALYSFSDKMENLSINFLFGAYSLNQILFGGMFILGMSLYLYALNCIRFDFPSLLNIKALRYLELGAHFFYVLAIFVYPLLILYLWMQSLVIFWLSQYITVSIKISFPREIIDLILSILALIVTASVTIMYGSKSKNQLFEIQNEEAEEASLKAQYNFETGKYNYVPIHLYNRVLQILKAYLSNDYGYSLDRISNTQQIELALNKGIIDEDSYLFIKHLKNLRNNLAHSDHKSISKETVESLISKTKLIISKLEDNFNKNSEF